MIKFIGKGCLHCKHLQKDELKLIEECNKCKEGYDLKTEKGFNAWLEDKPNFRKEGI